MRNQPILIVSFILLLFAFVALLTVDVLQYQLIDKLQNVVVKNNLVMKAYEKQADVCKDFIEQQTKGIRKASTN